MYGDLDVVGYSGKLTKFKQKNLTIDKYVKEFLRISLQVHEKLTIFKH